MDQCLLKVALGARIVVKSAKQLILKVVTLIIEPEEL